MNIQIRKLLPSESASYREIRLQCLKHYPEYFTTNYQDEKTKEKLFFQPYIEQAHKSNFVIGAFHSNSLIGISGFKRHERKKVNHAGIIIQVYVNSKFQGKNIGTDLIKHTLDEAFKIDGIEQVEIGVIAINEKAEKLYKNIGFEMFGLHKNFLKIENLYYDHKMMMIFKTNYSN
ncbi:GNAT family N-acetyltransferase [Psychroserpens luteolus]|uniref:GNAT family N-acetyltransferase n=1 Tax=Psychroserpens luteolus TaxID=2855840 RepID=UPI001E51A568|nr:GNAT family protein [Psychroserpens luteolus]MCD2259982.1 GNAT family N-acetyltransferase [Psychroserpens luteolus]